MNAHTNEFIRIINNIDKDLFKDQILLIDKLLLDPRITDEEQNLLLGMVNVLDAVDDFLNP